MKMTPRIFLNFWIPVIVYCAIIFTVSSMPRVLPEKLVFPGVDKILHAVEYGLLCYLLMRALRGSGTKMRRWALIAMAISLATLYGASDEYHQLFVPGRESSVYDLLFDFIGSFIVGLMKR